MSNVTCHADQGDSINLIYVDQNKRLEKQTGFMNPILPADLKELMHCDAFVFVPITDFEVPLETLRLRLGDLDARGVVHASGQDIDALYAERRVLYERWADVRVDCGGLDHDEAVQRILDVTERGG